MRFMWDRNADDKIAKKVFGVLRQTATLIKGVSQSRCPVDSGTLRDSAVIDTDYTKYEVTVGYGGAASKYALIQHENLQFHHDVGQAKYLETAFTEIVPSIDGKIKNRLQPGFDAGDVLE
jgi:hypothetical protein